MVPSSLGCGSTVLAAMATLAPSAAAFSPMARPMPRAPPVMNSVFPFSDMPGPRFFTFLPYMTLAAFEADGQPSSSAALGPAMQLSGIHHLTAVSADAPGNVKFYTKLLGLRLVKKTVNQDDVSAYHLFYADGLASPGSDITFFDFPTLPEGHGNNSITRVGMRVSGEASLQWWRDRLSKTAVTVGDIVERDGRLTLDVTDPEGQRLSLVDDGGKGEAHPWEKTHG